MPDLREALEKIRFLSENESTIWRIADTALSAPPEQPEPGDAEATRKALREYERGPALTREDAEKLARGTVNLYGRGMVDPLLITAVADLLQCVAGEDMAILNWIEEHVDSIERFGCGSDDIWYKVLHHDGNTSEGVSVREIVRAAIEGEKK